MDQDREEDFDDNWVAFDSVVEYTKALVGSDATFELDYLSLGRIGVFNVEPINPRARSISVIAEQFLIVTLGDHGGRWELNYGDDDIAFARQIIAAAVAGRVQERSALGRSRVSVTTDDGRAHYSFGYEGLSLLVPSSDGRNGDGSRTTNRIGRRRQPRIRPSRVWRFQSGVGERGPMCWVIVNFCRCTH